jgi:MFS family permease
MRLALGKFLFRLRRDGVISLTSSRMGSVFSGMTAGFLVSPIIAGIVYHNTGYLEVFILVFAVLTFDFTLRATMIEKKRAAKWHEAEKSQATHSAEGENNEYSDDWSSSSRNHGVAKSVARHGDSIREESEGEPNETSPLIRRCSAPPQDELTRPKSGVARLFPKMSVLLSSPRLVVAVLGCFTHMIIVTSFDACLPLFAKRTFGWNSSGAGLIFLPLTLPALFGAAYGALSDRYGPKKVSLSGFGIATIFLAMLALISENTILHKVFLSILLVIVGQYLSPQPLAIQKLDA